EALLQAPQGGGYAGHLHRGHLAAGVHPGVGAASAARAHRLAERGRERALERILHRGAAGLHLPALVASALVLDDQPELHSASRTRCPIARQPSTGSPGAASAAVRGPAATPAATARATASAAARAARAQR